MLIKHLMGNLVSAFIPNRAIRKRIRAFFRKDWFRRIDVMDEHEISLFGFPIYQWGSRILLDGQHEQFVRLFHKSLEHQFLDYILSFVPKEHDLVFVLRGLGSGDVRLSAMLFDELSGRYDAKNPVVAGWSQKQADVIQMMKTDYPVFINSAIKGKFFDAVLLNKKYKYKGKIFLTMQMPRKDALLIYENCKATGKTQPQYYLDFWGCCKYQCFAPYISDENIIAADKFLKILGLKNKKFIYLVSQANTSSILPTVFWKQIVSAAKDMGFNIFENTVDGNANYGKSIICNFAQSVHIASQSSMIIGLRAGMTEILSHIPVQKHIIYTRINNMDIVDIMSICRLSAYPMTNTAMLTEYNSETDGLNYIAEKIIGEMNKVIGE